MSEAMERAEVAALVAMARAGLASDHQELLTYGDPMRSIPPRLLRAALRAAFPILAEELISRVEDPPERDWLPKSLYATLRREVLSALRTRISEIAGGEHAG